MSVFSIITRTVFQKQRGNKIQKIVEIYFKKIYNNKGSYGKGEPYAGIAQSVEHFTRNEGVVSSSLISGFLIVDAESLVKQGIQRFLLPFSEVVSLLYFQYKYFAIIYLENLQTI